MSIERPIVWMGASYADLLAFPEDARRVAVYVLHAFEKKTSRTTLPDLALARRRLAMILIR